ncbi:cell division protein ZapA [Brevirhabdus sp.]|uniref:cell division protein ZapA n=1 Tax=Brevirhabdus sp. TaxID=2004514 RepID=UPI0040597759
MTEVVVNIGGRSFEVACQAGEEHYLQSAASLLDAEAEAILSQIGRLPENRMLLMAGLMLADKTAGVSEELARLKKSLGEAQARIAELQSAPQPEPQTIQVPVIPPELHESMAEIAARAESLADQIAERTAAE